ncbi:MAG TPA: alanine dehydrogenase, partial [Opitutus sp.]|nr:alanine dehydrogenase [Opitutus sp.]
WMKRNAHVWRVRRGGASLSFVLRKKRVAKARKLRARVGDSPASRARRRQRRCDSGVSACGWHMRIGVPKEIKTGETRVSMTPNLCRRCVKLGAKVWVEKSAGLNAGFSDAEYRAAGATLAGSAGQVWESAEVILKVKEPLPREFDLLQEGQTVFTYLHLAAGADLARRLVEKQVLGIAYETVESADGQFPLLKPMSQIAGRLSIQIGAYFLQTQHGGSGVLLGGIPGTMPGHVVVVGGGNSGAHAVQMAAGMGARVTVLDLDTRKLEAIDTEYRGRVVTLMSNPANIEHAVEDADLLVGAVLIPAAKAPIVVTRKMVSRMRPGSVIVDIAIDQGGCIETIRPTSHTQPVYSESGVIHYAVPNMPALVGRTSTLALTQATEPYVAMLVQKGVQRALAEHSGLARGVNTRDGKIVNEAVATAVGLG